MEIFKFTVLPSEGARSHGVKALCLVNKDWNNIANVTPDLWTKVTFACPLHADQLSAAQKWLKVSKPKVIDVEIDLCDPSRDWFSQEDWHPLADLAWLPDVIRALRGSENRWRSFSIRSDTWSLIRELLRTWVIPSLPLLESISLELSNEVLGLEYLQLVYGRSVELPILFGGAGTLMHKLREVSLVSVPADWTPAATSFRNLRKLEIRNQHFINGPDFEQFATILAASPRLEVLDISGYWPASYILPIRTRIPFVHLPALKCLVLGWTRINFTCEFLRMFQIPDTLETLSLVDINVYQDEYSGLFAYDYPSPIFELLANLGSADPRNRDFSSPWISTAGLKSLSVFWAECNSRTLIALLQGAPMIEEIRLTNISQATLEGIVALVETPCLRSLKRLYLRWVRDGGYESEEARLVIDLLRGHGLQVVIEKFTGEDSGLTPIVDAERRS